MQPAVGVALLAASWALLTRVPVPGVGAGHLTPTANVEGWVDRRVFGTAHLYRSGTVGYDPEGLLGTLGAVVSVLAGYWAAHVLRREGWRVGIIGVAAISAGSLWGHVLPVNKRLWTPPYVVLMAGVSLCLLTILHVLFDRRALLARALAYPWRVLGANALVVYVGTELSGAALGAWQHVVAGQRVALSVWIWGAWLRPHVGARPATIAFGALLLAAWWAVAVVLYRARIAVRD